MLANGAHGVSCHSLAALKLVPDFVPASLIAARIYINRGDSRKAMSLLRRVWRATSHPDVATLFANAVPGTSAVDRLKRVRELIDTPPQNKPAAKVYGGRGEFVAVAQADDVAAITARLLSDLPVQDLTIEDPPIEAVIEIGSPPEYRRTSPIARVRPPVPQAAGGGGIRTSIS